MASPDAPPATHRRRPRLLGLPDVRGAGTSDWIQLIRFCVVGASGYVLNLGVFAALVKGADAHYLGAATVAFCVAWTSNFVLNKHWTFRRRGGSTLHQGAKNLTVSLVAFGLNLILLHFLIVAGVPKIGAQAIAIAAVTPVNFLLNRRWSFR